MLLIINLSVLHEFPKDTTKMKNYWILHSGSFCEFFAITAV